MSPALILVLSILGLGALYVLLPVTLHTLLFFRPSKTLCCPETGEEGKVEVDAPHAALTSAFGRPRLRLKSCSLWPLRKDCRQGCLRLLKGG